MPRKSLHNWTAIPRIDVRYRKREAERSADSIEQCWARWDGDEKALAREMVDVFEATYEAIK